MRFSIGLIALTAATANALVPAPTLTLRLSDITLIVTNLLGPVDKISTGSMVPFLSGNGPVYTLATDLTKGVQISTQLFSGSGFTSSDSLTHATTDPLLAAVVKLADSTTALMNGISSKGTVFSSSPMVAVPVNAILTSTKNSFDNLLNAITTALATSSAAQDGTLNKAIASIATMDTAFLNALDATNAPST